MDQLGGGSYQKPWFAGTPAMTPVAETAGDKDVERARSLRARVGASAAEDRPRESNPVCPRKDWMLRRCAPCKGRPPSWPSAIKHGAQQDAAATPDERHDRQWSYPHPSAALTCVVTSKDGSRKPEKLELEPAARALPCTKGNHGLETSLGACDIVRLQDAAGQAVIDCTEVE